MLSPAALRVAPVPALRAASDYVQHPSLRADLAILARTVGVLLRRPKVR